MKSFIITVLYLLSLSLSSSAPDWQRQPLIDAGQTKPINFEPFIRTGNRINTAFPGANVFMQQQFNTSTFTTGPRVVVGMLSHGIVAQNITASTVFGHRFIMGTSNRTHFRYNVTTVGVSYIALHFKYLAVQGFNSLINMQIYSLTFNASSTLRTSSPTNRTQTVTLDHPQGLILGTNITSNPQLFINAWPISFVLEAPNSMISYNVTANIMSPTSFALNVFAGAGMMFQQLTVSVIVVNSTALYMHTYSHYIDYSLVYLVGSVPFVATFTTYTDIPTQYQYRNEINLYCGVVLPIAYTATPSFFYFNITSSASSVLSGLSFQTRIRVCSNSTPFFKVSDQRCYVDCLSTQGKNTTYNYCKLCHYTCLTCTQGGLPNSCNTCPLASFRSIMNSTCGCDFNYFDNNTLVCASCHYTCLTCGGDQVNQCISCNSTAGRIINSSNICKCMDGFYQSTFCLPCLNYCATCTLNGSAYVCLSCNTTQGRVLSSNQSSCQCPALTSSSPNGTCISCGLGCLSCNFTSCLSCNSASGFQLTNGTCQCSSGLSLTGSVCVVGCGNSVLDIGQQCDDGNALQSDGCSSNCIIQTNHACLNNNSASPPSICYYNRSIQLKIQQVFKHPFENRVTLTFDVNAPNCNQQLLKQYLASTSLTINATNRLLQENSNRLMQTSDLQNVVSVYSSSSQQLQTTFTYTQNIDLSFKKLSLSPTLDSLLPNRRYFFDSPLVQISLTRPTNRLMTTFSSQQQQNASKALSFVYLALVIVWWVWMVVGFFFQQTAMVVQGLLVLQITYQTLLQNQYVYDGWLGLTLYGRFTYGFKVDYDSTFNQPFSVIGLNSNLFNTLNTTLVVAMIAIVVLVGMVFYQTATYCFEQGSDDNQTNARMDNQPQPKDQSQKFQCKKRIVVFLFELLLGLTLLTPKIVIMSLIKVQDVSVTPTGVVGALMLAMYLSVWIFYFKCYDSQFMLMVSFRKMTKNAVKDSKNCSTFINLVLKFYYLIIFSLMVIASIINATSFVGSALFLTIAVSTLIFLMLVFVIKVYYRKAHLVRTTINCVCLIICMILHAIPSFQSIPSVQNIAFSLAACVCLYASLFTGIVVMVRIQYRKYKAGKKSARNKRIKNIQYDHNVTIQQQLGKQELPPPDQNLNEQTPVQHIAVRQIVKKGQFQDLSQIMIQTYVVKNVSQDPLAVTRKKVAVVEENGGKTNEKNDQSSAQLFEDISSPVKHAKRI